MEMYSKSFAEYIKREDAEENTPIGQLRLRFLELYPEYVFNRVSGIKCINGLDSCESRKWSAYVVKASLTLTDSIYVDELHNLKDLNNGDHILLAEWFYHFAYNGLAYKRNARLTRFQNEFRFRVLNKLTKKLGNFQMSLAEKEALCSYLLLRNSYMKYKDMFVPDRLLALKAINRFAKAHDIRYEDSEIVLRSYTYLM
jgi:hypothetical protein